MTKLELLEDYKIRLKLLKSKLENVGLDENEIKTIILDSINSQKQLTSEKNNGAYNKHKLFRLFRFGLFIIIFYVFFGVTLGKPISIFVCKIQDFIYPVLRILRVLSIPILKVFPSLSGLYDESCLVHNPYFYVNDLSCWVCKDVNKVEEYKSIDQQINTMPPFIFKTNQKQLTVNHILKLYENNKQVFNSDASQVLINGSKYILAENFFNNYIKSQDNFNVNNYMWKLTRLKPIQLIKSLFPRPDIIPQHGLSIERFISIDEVESSSYQLPDTECNYVFVIQSQGERLIQLQPATECAEECHSVFVTLRPSYMLWYNWWYWKPISQKVLSNETSISFIASYC